MADKNTNDSSYNGNIYPIHNGQTVSGDSKITVNHSSDTSSMDISVDKRDVAQIYVVQIKQKTKASIKKAKASRQKLADESVELVSTIKSLIDSTVAKAFKSKVDKVTQTYKDLRADIKALVKKASANVDEAVASLFTDTEEIDSRIKTTVTTPSISYDWRAGMAVKEDGSGKEEVLNVTLSIDGHRETKELAIPSQIAQLKVQQLALDVSIKSFDTEISDHNELLNSTPDLQEAAEAAVAQAKLSQSDFGKQCLAGLERLNSTGQLLLGTSSED